MKVVVVAVCMVLISALHAPVVLAKGVKEYRADAKQYYQEQKYSKAYSVYYRLAKSGDFYSQNKVANMLEKGEGKKVDLTEAYAWSVLAAESGIDGLTEKSDRLLELVPDQAKAEKRVARLKQKYGREALQSKADRRESIKFNHKSGGCTGSKLGCSKS